jgi:hypothetical protein
MQNFKEILQKTINDRNKENKENNDLVLTKIQTLILKEVKRGFDKLEYRAIWSQDICNSLIEQGLNVTELIERSGLCDCTMSYGCNHPDPPEDAPMITVGYFIRWSSMIQTKQRESLSTIFERW